MQPHRLLVVDPDDETRAETAADLRGELPEAVTVETPGTAEAATAALEGTPPVAAVVTEYELPDGTGLDVIEAAAEAVPDAGCVLYTDADPDRIDTAALRGSITEYVGKDSLFGEDRLARLVRTTVESRSQASYPLPQNEAERVAALRAYDLDDETLIESLDRITSLAAAHFEVSRASINIINEHSQDFLACHGPAGEWESMDREDSICTFTILEDDVMTVPDVTADPRFRSRSETLIDMGIRAYMGANMVTGAGLRIGPVCVYDDVPREFDAADEAYLADLADLAGDLIELHARVGGDGGEA